jgi:hypothetical protein
MASTLSMGLSYLAKEQITQLLNDLNSDTNSVSYPLIYTAPQVINPKTSSSFVMVNPLRPNNIVYGNYPDLDKDKQVHKTVTKYFYYKILDKWLYNELRPLLAFVKIVDGKPQLIRSMNDFKPNELSDESVENIEKRIAYMEHIIITKKLVKHVLKKIVAENNIHWYHINKNEDMVKKVFNKYIKNKLEEAIENYNKQ